MFARGPTTYDRAVPRDAIQDLPIVRPPLDTQVAIARFLDAETKRVETAKERLLENARLAGELIERKLVAAVLPSSRTRADSGFWNTKVFERLERAGWQYSIGVRMIKTVRAAVQTIDEDAWTTIADYTEDGEVGERNGSPKARDVSGPGPRFGTSSTEGALARLSSCQRSWLEHRDATRQRSIRSLAKRGDPSDEVGILSRLCRTPTTD